MRIRVEPSSLRSSAGRLGAVAGNATTIASGVPASAPGGITPEPACDAALQEMLGRWQRVLEQIAEDLHTFATALRETAEMYSMTETSAKRALTPLGTGR